MAARKVDRLRSVYAGAKTECLIVVASEIKTAPPESWQKNSEEPWLKVLFRTTIPNSEILSYEEDYDSGNAFSWQDLLKSGETLLNSLLELRNDSTVAECPIQFICIGLGGIIVKEAIQIAHQQPYHFKELLSVIAGFVFIGTPHSRSAQESVWKTISVLPSLKIKNVTKRSLTDKDVSRLANACAKFEDVEFDRPILSVYESRKTAISRAFRQRQVMVVGKTLCTINSRNQIFLETNSDYLTICHLSSHGETFGTLCKFVRTAVTSAQLRIMMQMARRDESIHPDRYTVRTESLCSDGAQLNTGQGTTGSKTASYQMVPMVTDFTLSRRVPKLPCYIHKHQTRNKVFFGRSDILERLETALIPPYEEDGNHSPRELRTFSLCGLGGIGKSEIAAEFMFSNKGKFDAVFWLQADEPTKLRDGFSEIAISLNLEDAADAKDQIASTNLVKGWLADPLKDPEAPVDSAARAKWLLIFDNVDDPEDLDEFWPQFGQGSVLITSRDPLAKTNVYAATSGIDLTPFSDKDAANFLLKLTNTESSLEGSVPKDALAVAHRLGGLPLGLIQMAGVINRQDYTFEEFLRRYEEKSLPELHKLQIGRQTKGYTHTIASVWALERLSRETSSLLDVISLLDPDGIPEQILTQGAGDVGLEAYPKIDKVYEEARADLTKRSLVTRNKKEHELRIHRLTQDAARAKMDPTYLEIVFNATVTLVFAAWPWAKLNQRHSTVRWSTCEALIPSVLRLQELYSSFVLPNNLFKAELYFAHILTDAAWYTQERGGGDNFAEFLDLAQIICEAQERDPRYALSDIHYTRGAEAAETNKFDVALENNMAFLRLRLDISQTSNEGRRDPMLAQAYNQAAKAHMDKRMFAEAIGLYEQSLAVFKSLDDFTETMTTICVANLATAYWLQRRFDDAATILMRNLRAREVSFGPNDSESFRTGRLLHVMGNVRASQGQLGESLDFHHRALVQYRSSIGNNHHRTAALCCKVAEGYMRLGQSDAAQSLLDQALQIYRSREHFRPELARTFYLRSRMFLLMGKDAEASEAQASALTLYRTIRVKEARADEDILGPDFDDIVCFASR